MFPNSPDKRLLLSKTEVAKDLTSAQAGLRLFGFITPGKSGVYLFEVKFCPAEVWLSHNENWRNARKMWDSRKLSEDKKHYGVSDEIGLIAGKKYFIEVVATCFRQRNNIQLLWKAPMSSSFEVINGSFLSHYMDDSGLNNSKIYDDLLPDSPVCALRRNKTTYFQVQREISYLSHDEVKDILPYFVHTYVYPFPEHNKLHPPKYRKPQDKIHGFKLALDKDEALGVVGIFLESLEREMPGKFSVNEIRNVERKTDKKRGNRCLIEAELLDLTNNRKVMLSEYVFMPNGTKELCYPDNFQWNRTVNVYLIVTAKNLGRWVHHFIKNVEKIVNETNDPNLHVIIYDYNSSDINLEKVLKESSLTNYMFLSESGEFSKTRSLTEAINLVSDPHSIIFTLDLHLDIGAPFINNIRKHCIEGRMVYTPIIVRMELGANPIKLAGMWQVYGYGIIGMYKSDWDRSGEFPTDHKNEWGGEDHELMDQLVSVGLEFERMRTTYVYHYYHSKKGMWTDAT
ncbi:hypothetical protein ACROYT_G036126 [Oculina patagonica]